jgi:ABC-type branched-subunit amino acid transport system permease subunit
VWWRVPDLVPGATTSDFFQFSTSILVLIMVILGGIGNIWGVLAGAIALVYIDKSSCLARPVGP